jgi:hypothetical protein
MKFRDFVRLKEGVDLSDIRDMILRAIGGNPESHEAFNAPLTQFVEPGDLVNRLNSLKGLADLIKDNASAIDAIQNAQTNNLTVGQLAVILTRQG